MVNSLVEELDVIPVQSKDVTDIQDGVAVGQVERKAFGGELVSQVGGFGNEGIMVMGLLVLLGWTGLWFLNRRLYKRCEKNKLWFKSFATLFSPSLVTFLQLVLFEIILFLFSPESGVRKELTVEERSQPCKGQ